MAAPGFISKGTKDEGNGSSVSPVYPGSINSGDFLYILAISIQGTVGNISNASGYTIIQEEIFTWGTVALMRKTATGSESGSETVNRSGSSGGGGDFFMAQIYVERGDAIYLTTEDTAVTSDEGNTTITFDAVTVGGNERTLLAFVADYNGSGVSAPSGYSTSATDASIGISGTTIALFSKENVSSDGSVTTSGATDGWGAYHISLYNNLPKTRSFIVN